MSSLVFSLGTSLMFVSLYFGLLADKCRYDTFFEWSSLHVSGSVIQVIDQSVDVKLCERACLLYADCVGYNVNWTNPDQAIGTCVILGTKSLWAAPDLVGEGRSFFEKNYEGSNIALSSDTSHPICSSDSSRSCDYAVDGNLLNPWISNKSDVRYSIQLNFGASYEVQRIDIYHRRLSFKQCKSLDISFSDGKLLQFDRECYGNSSGKGERLNMYYINKQRTSSLKIQCRNICSENRHRGFVEILVWAIKAT